MLILKLDHMEDEAGFVVLGLFVFVAGCYDLTCLAKLADH